MESAGQLTLIAPPVPVVKPHEVEALVGVLREAKGWLTAAELAALIGKPTASFERRIRAIANVAAPAVVSYPGSPGYRWWNACSIEEIDRCIAALDAQGREMMKRANVYRCAYYRRHREPVAVTAVQGELL
jgi:hypothetical protein